MRGVIFLEPARSTATSKGQAGTFEWMGQFGTHADELELIRRARAGDRLASGDLIRAHQGALYGYLVRMCARPALAEDISQETFVRALTHLDSFDGQYRFSTWLFTIARRLLMNELQRRRPVNAGEGVLDGVVARIGTTPPQTQAEAVDRDDLAPGLRESLRRALQSLSVEQREAVVLFHQLEWPIALIAGHMNLPVGTVKSHLHRGRDRLREALESMGYHGEDDPEVQVRVAKSGARHGRGRQQA